MTTSLNFKSLSLAVAATALFAGCSTINPTVEVPTTPSSTSPGSVYGGNYAPGQSQLQRRIFPATELDPRAAFLGVCVADSATKDGMRTDFSLVCGGSGIAAVDRALAANGQTVESVYQAAGQAAPAQFAPNANSNTHTVRYPDPKLQADCELRVNTLTGGNGLPSGTRLMGGFTVPGGQVIPLGTNGSSLSCQQQLGFSTFR